MVLSKSIRLEYQPRVGGILVVVPRSGPVPSYAVRGSGPRLRFTQSTDDAIQLFQEEPFKVLICSWPENSTCAEQIRRMPGGDTVELILLSEPGSSSELLKAFATRVQAHSVYPIGTPIVQVLLSLNGASPPPQPDQPPPPPLPSFPRSHCKKARQRLSRDLARLAGAQPELALGLPPDAPPLLVRRIARRMIDRYQSIAEDARWPSDIRTTADRIRELHETIFLTGAVRRL